MKHKVAITSLILSGSLAVGGGLAISQTPSESNQPGGSLPGATQPKGSGSGVDRMPDAGGIGKETGKSGMNFSSDEIKEIQQALKEKGHDPGLATGVMDEKTRAAIRDFQKANNLSVTGNLNQETAQKLGVSVSGSAGGSESGSTGSGIGSGSSRSKSGGSASGSSGSESGLGSGSSGSESRGTGSGSTGSSVGSGSSDSKAE